MADDDVGPGHRRRVGLTEDIGRRQQVFRTRAGDHVDLQRKAHPGFLKIGAEIAVDQADGGEGLHACKARLRHLIEEPVHDAERVGGADAGQNGRVFHHRQNSAAIFITMALASP